MDLIKRLNTGNYLGYSDWRLPNLNELASLLNQEETRQSAWLGQQGFVNAIPGNYWTSTSVAYNASQSWIIHFVAGNVEPLSKTSTALVWPVRGKDAETKAAVVLPKTGQLSCYNESGVEITCKGTGQDGELQAGAEWPVLRFSQNDDQTVTDNVTGLIWAKSANLIVLRDPSFGSTADGKVLWHDALDYVSRLNRESYLGYSDWRLPNRNEMVSLVNYAETNPASWITIQGINNPQLYYWSSTTSASSPPNAWNIDLSGSVTERNKYDSTNGSFVWPVRGAHTKSSTQTSQLAAGIQTSSLAAAAAPLAAVAALSVSTSTLPAGIVSSAYSQTLAATGGTTPYTWTRTTGSLPAGLTLSTAGVISGTPTAAATSTFTVQVKDKAAKTATKSLSIIVSTAPLSITTSSLADRYLATAYSQTLTATGGKTAYSWSITSGTLPTGLTLAATTGVLSGTPTVTGTSTITIQVKDANNAIATKALIINVYALPTISTASLSSSPVGTIYSQTLSGTGGKAPYAWSFTTGTLPAGLTLAASTGLISGTPTTAGTSSITFKVTDANAKTATKVLSITVNATPPAITTTTLTDGYVGVSYSQALAATGGKTPYTWSRTAGSLPAGLYLSSAGVISGTPTTAGTSNFTVQVRDSNNTTKTAPLSITIVPAVSVATSTLSSGVVGSSYNQTLEANGGKMPYTWSIISGALPSGLSLNASSGAITGTPAVVGGNNFEIQVKDANNKIATSNTIFITINPPLEIVTTKLHDSFIGVEYSQALAVSGGLPPYTWSISSGSLPVGLNLDTATGIISGTPTAINSSSCAIQVRDAGNVIVSSPFSIAITGFGSISGTITDQATGAPLPGGTAMLKLDFTGKNGNVFTCNDAAIGTLDYATIAENDKNKYSCLPGVVNTMKFNVRNPFGTDPFTIRWNGISGFKQGTEYLAQSFKPTKNGTLTKASFYLGGGYSTEWLTLQLKTELGGDRGTQLAVSARAVPNATAPWVDFVFVTPVSVNAGQTYYLEIQGGVWYDCGSGYCVGTVECGKGVAYPDGAVSNRAGGIWYPQTDTLAFQTYLDNQVDVAVLPSADGASMGMSGDVAQKMTLSLYNRSAGNWNSGGTVDRLGPDLGGFEYNGDDLTINWPVISGLEQYYDQNGWLMAKVDNEQYRWNNPPYTNLVTDQFSLTFNRTLITTTDANGAYSFANLPDGNYSLTFYKTDYADIITSGTLSAGQNLNIGANLATYTDTVISTNSLADGIGYFYDETLKVTGNKAPYSWAVTSGSLPAGFTLVASEGRIYGNSSVAGRSNFTVQVKGSDGITITKALSILIYGNAWNIAETSLPNATVGTAYNKTLTVIDNSNAPFTWSIARGSLPPGLTLNSSTGEITGTPTTTGTSTLAVMLQDASATTSFRWYSLYVSPRPYVNISTSTLPDALIGTAYNQSLSVTGGTAPFTWSIPYGGLPAGLTLNSSTGAITGMPTAAGTGSFYLLVTDAISQAAKILTITVIMPPFIVRNLGDSGNVTVMELTGNYDAMNTDSTINDKPRQAIVKEFIRSHADTFDFVVFLSTFDYAMPDLATKGFYTTVKNDTQGISQPIMDNTALYGSNGKLQGTVDMGNVTALAAATYGPKLDEALTTLSHELVHRFGAYVRFKNPDGTLNSSLLGKDLAHWSYLLDSKGSLMYGNGWNDNGNGTFTSVSKQSAFSPLDLYLMGMIPKEQVPPMLLIDNPAIDKTQLPQLGATVTGTAKTVTIDDIVAAEGERIPNAATAQKQFNVGFVLLTRARENTTAAAQAIETLRKAWAGRFAELTQGKGSAANIPASLEVLVDSPAEGATITGPDVMVSGTVINTSGVETGIIVNGMPATVSGGRFIINHVPITEGANTITITAADVNGLTATTTRSVTSIPGHYLRITSNIESGTAPLEISLRIEGSFNVTSPQITVTGNTAVEWLPWTSATELGAKITLEGTLAITASAVGPDGATYSDTVTITVMSRQQMETLLKGKWDGMKQKVITGDILGAGSYFSMANRDRFQAIFNDPSIEAATRLNEISAIEIYTIMNDTAQAGAIKLEDDGEYSYPINFTRDENGLWSIYGF